MQRKHQERLKATAAFSAFALSVATTSCWPLLAFCLGCGAVGAWCHHKQSPQHRQLLRQIAANDKRREQAIGPRLRNFVANTPG